MRKYATECRTGVPMDMRVTDLFGVLPSKRQEAWNALTHGMGLFVSIPASIVLLFKAFRTEDEVTLLASVIFSFALLFLYAASTLYHSIQRIRIKFFLRKLDHSAIYIFIAASYTPFSLILLRDHPWMGWPLFVFIWSAAVAGIMYKTFFIHKFDTIATLLYLAMGWVAILGVSEIVQRLEPAGLVLLVAGGLSYTLGVAFYFWSSLRAHHAKWHLFVLSGSLLHYWTIHSFVL